MVEKQFINMAKGKKRCLAFNYYQKMTSFQLKIYILKDTMCTLIHLLKWNFHLNYWELSLWRDYFFSWFSLAVVHCPSLKDRIIWRKEIYILHSKWSSCFPQQTTLFQTETAAHQYQPKLCISMFLMCQAIDPHSPKDTILLCLCFWLETAPLL